MSNPTTWPLAVAVFSSAAALAQDPILPVVPPHQATLNSSEVETPTDPVDHPAASPEATAGNETTINRIFAGRLTEHEPTYLTYGDGEKSAAKFQFSFKYRFASFNWGERARSNIHLGYTERALWDIEADSSPFYDTSYMPELFIDLIPRPSNDNDQRFRWLGAATGVKHESNGRDGLDSRSMNTVYLRTGFAFGDPEAWQFILVPEVFGYLSADEGIEDYRGYGILRAIVGKKNGPSLAASASAGDDLGIVTYQLEFTHPIRTRLLDVETFLFVQYFNGYGESIKDFDHRTNSLRVGLALVR